MKECGWYTPNALLDIDGYEDSKKPMLQYSVTTLAEKRVTAKGELRKLSLQGCRRR